MGETPLPIPNRAVKPHSADGTWLARARESRSPPVYPDEGPSLGAALCRCGCRVVSARLACVWVVLGRGPLNAGIKGAGRTGAGSETVAVGAVSPRETESHRLPRAPRRGGRIAPQRRSARGVSVGASRGPDRGGGAPDGARMALDMRVRGDRGQAALRPLHPCTGPARPSQGTQRHTVRVRVLAIRRARSGELKVLQEDEGAREAGGAPQGGVNGDGALTALVGEREHVFGSVGASADGTRVRAIRLAIPCGSRRTFVQICPNRALSPRLSSQFWR